MVEHREPSAHAAQNMFKFGSTLDAAKHGLAEERCPRIRSLDNNGIYREEILNDTGTARS